MQGAALTAALKHKDRSDSASCGRCNRNHGDTDERILQSGESPRPLQDESSGGGQPEAVTASSLSEINDAVAVHPERQGAETEQIISRIVEAGGTSNRSGNSLPGSDSLTPACQVSNQECASVQVRDVEFDPANEKHYIIIVHGTWDAPPTNGTRTWYQPPLPGGTNFSTRLASLLSPGAIGSDAVWRELPDEIPAGLTYPFCWDGNNTHQSRVSAAQKLAQLLFFITTKDPAARIHLIAHSHGGNIVLKTIELYALELAKMPLSSFHPAIHHQFQQKYGRGMEYVKRWRAVDVAWYWRCFPFLVVWRSYTGGLPRPGADSFPFAYYRWLDHFLCLGPWRQRLYRTNRQVTSPLTNALGAMVFLGTPFYIKQWRNLGILILSASTLAFMVVGFVVLLGYVTLWRALFIQTWKDIGFFSGISVELNVTAFIEISVGISVVIQLLRNTVFYSGNLYHNPHHGWSPAMTALVVHAGKLDEASLALSTEPIVRAYLFPQLYTMLRRQRLLQLPKLPEKPYTAAVLSLYALDLWLHALWNVLFFLPMVFLSFCTLFVMPVFAQQIRKLAVVLSFGLRTGELDYADVYVDELLDLPLESHTIDHWNVQELLAEAKVNSAKGQPMEGYGNEASDGSFIGSHNLKGSSQHSQKASSQKLQRTSLRQRAEVGEEKRDPSIELSGAAASGPSVRPAGASNARKSQTVEFAMSTLHGEEDERDVQRSPGASDCRLQDSLHNEEETADFTRGRRSPAEAELTVREDAALAAQFLVSDSESEQQQSNLYEFLWNDDVLDALAEQSWTYKALEGQVDSIPRNPRLTSRAFERHLKQICVMIEERLKELTGRVDVNHGSYFRDPRILQVIAYYIENRSLAPWARDWDTATNNLEVIVDPREKSESKHRNFLESFSVRSRK